MRDELETFQKEQAPVYTQYHAEANSKKTNNSEAYLAGGHMVRYPDKYADASLKKAFLAFINKAELQENTPEAWSFSELLKKVLLKQINPQYLSNRDLAKYNPHATKHYSDDPELTESDSDCAILPSLRKSRK